MSFAITGADVAEVLVEFMRRWGRVMTTDLESMLLDFRLDDFVDDLCLRIADNPGLPVDLERGELRAVLAARLLVVLSGAIEDDKGTFLTSPVEPSLEMIVGAVFGQLLAGARLPPQWNGERCPQDLLDFRNVRRP